MCWAGHDLGTSGAGLFMCWAWARHVMGWAENVLGRAWARHELRMGELGMGRTCAVAGHWRGMCWVVHGLGMGWVVPGLGVGLAVLCSRLGIAWAGQGIVWACVCAGHVLDCSWTWLGGGGAHVVGWVFHGLGWTRV